MIQFYTKCSKMFPILFLIVVVGGVVVSNPTSSCNNEISKQRNLACEELCQVVLNKFSVSAPNVSNTLPPNISPDSHIVNHEPKHSVNWDEYLEASSIIFGLSKLASKKILSDECFKSFKTLEKGILNKETWAIKVRESSGEKVAGFVWGHTYWLGSKDGCAGVRDPPRITLSNQIERIMKKDLVSQLAPFDMDYRVVYLNQSSPWQVEVKTLPERIIHVGLCLPSVCSSSEILNLTQNLLDTKVLESEILDLHSEAVYVKDLKLKDSFFKQKKLKITLGVVAFTVTMSFLAWYLSDTKLMNSGSSLFVFIKCFDFAKNASELFTLRESSPGIIPVVNGLRSVSCFWILFFHVMVYMYFTVDNKTILLSYVEDPYFQYVSIAPLIVDLFFAISGFMHVYLFLQKQPRLDKIRRSSLGQNVQGYMKVILSRYLRLAPLYLVIMGIVSISTSYFKDVSVFHIYDRYDQTCSKHWWRNLLFIQNLFDFKDICLNWSWSLACEMQYYFLVSGLLFAYAKYPKIVKNLVVTALVSSILWTYILGIKHHYQFSMDMIAHTCNQLYINPFVRIAPYLIGSIGGWYFAENKGQLKLSSTTEKRIWNLVVVALLGCVFSNLKRDLSPFSSITLLIASRLGIALIVCWLILASATGRRTWWTSILEWKIFQHTNRVSYAIYILNPLIIDFVFSFSNSSSHVDPLQLLILAGGFSVVTYVASLIFSLAFEVPYCKLSSILLKDNAKTVKE